MAIIVKVFYFILLGYFKPLTFMDGLVVFFFFQFFFPSVRMVLRGWARQNGQYLSLLVDIKAKIEEGLQLFF